MQKKALNLPVDQHALTMAKQANPQAQLVIKAKPGMSYKLFDHQTDKPFEMVKVMRKGGDLEIRILEQTRSDTDWPADVVIKDFYTQENVSLLGQEVLSDGQLTAINYVPSVDMEGSQVNQLASLSGLPDGLLLVAKSTEAASMVASAGAAPLVSTAAAATVGTSTVVGTSALLSTTSMGVAATGGGLVAATASSAASQKAATLTAAKQAMDAIESASEGQHGPAPTKAHYASLGLSDINTDSEVNLMGSAIAHKSAAEVDTLDEIKAMVNTVVKIMGRAAGGNETITQEEFTTLGIHHLNSAKTASLLQAIKASIDDGSAVDSVAEIQALADAAPSQESVQSSAPTSAENTASDTQSLYVNQEAAQHLGGFEFNVSEAEMASAQAAMTQSAMSQSAMGAQTQIHFNDAVMPV